MILKKLSFIRFNSSRMKVVLFLFLCCGILQLQCRKQDRGFQMNYISTPNTQFDIAVGLDPFKSHFYPEPVSSDTSLYFTANNVTAKQLGRITPYTMYLRAVYQDGSYDFVSNVEVTIFDPTRPNLTEQIIFYNDNVAVSTGTQITLIPNDVDVTPFIVQGKTFGIRIRIRLRDVPQRTITTGWNMAFFARD